MTRSQSHDEAERDPTGSRRQRVSTLRDLIAQRGYDVPGADVAASIIRDAIVVVAPLTSPRD